MLRLSAHCMTANVAANYWKETRRPKKEKKKLTCLEVFGRSVKHTEPYGLWAQKLLVCMVYSPPGAFVVVLVVLVVLGQIPSTS